MFNSDLKKEALVRLEEEAKIYESIYIKTVNSAEELYVLKNYTVKLIDKVEEFINLIANKPKEFDRQMSIVSVNKKGFTSENDKLKIESEKVVKVSGSTAGAGVVAGAGVAAFGPTAAMAVATTFGTASTGAAISTLSGAAATNAALAWLGGGALAAGGGGIAAGNALLALAGPVGWAIGGGTLIASGLYAKSKNKKIADEAEAEVSKILDAKVELLSLKTKVDAHMDSTSRLSTGVLSLLLNAKLFNNKDYSTLSVDEKHDLGALVNSVESLSVSINDKVS